MKIEQFYAVTTTSIYHVKALGPYRASAVKIACEGNSEIEKGHDIAEGGMIAIRKGLQGFIPEKYGFGHPMTGMERNIEMINTQWWRGGTSYITALFKTEEEAQECFRVTDRKPCDSRWIESTRTILEEIGDDHPSFSICRFGGAELLPSTPTA